MRSFAQVGLDTNILCYALDPSFKKEHQIGAKILAGLYPDYRIAINPTVVHETYHTLVYKQKWLRGDAGERLLALLKLKQVIFLNQTKQISANAISLANKYDLGGRDSLILSNYLFNSVPRMFTHDQHIAELEKVSIGEKELGLSDPFVRRNC